MAVHRDTPHGERFPVTRLSVLSRIREGGASERREAFDLLARAYWRPIYIYLRLRWRVEPSDAEDLTQGFLATAWAKHFFDDYDPQRARFRTFLRTCLDRFVHGQRKAERAVKRGGGAPVLSLDFVAAEGGVLRREPIAADDVETVFEQEFVRALFTGAVEQLRDELSARGREVVFTVFERYDLGPSDDLTYAELARALDLPVTRVTNHLHAARRRFREVVLDRLRELSGSEDEFRREARELLGLELR